MENVPVIDISALRDGDAATRRKIADAVRTAVEEIGFLSVTGHGVSDEIISRIRSESLAFFDLPLATKEKYLHPSGNLNRGYTPFEGEFNGSSTGQPAPADLREGYIFGQSVPQDTAGADKAVASHAYQPNIWPDVMPGLTETFQAYYSAVADFNTVLLEIFSAALDLELAYFRENFRHHSSTVRILHYPAQDAPPPAGQLRCGAHTDFGSHTILLADDSPGGLQVRTLSGEWVDVIPPANAFIINIGDMMKMWTNDRWVSNEHRVANPSTEGGPSGDRLSIAFFTYPNPDAVIECIPTCLAPGDEAKHPPVLAGDYRRMKVESTTAAAQNRS